MLEELDAIANADAERQMAFSEWKRENVETEVEQQLYNIEQEEMAALDSIGREKATEEAKQKIRDFYNKYQEFNEDNSDNTNNIDI